MRLAGAPRVSVSTAGMIVLPLASLRTSRLCILFIALGLCLDTVALGLCNFMDRLIIKIFADCI